MGEFESTNEIERIKATMIEAAQIASGELDPNPLEIFPAQGKAERRADIKWEDDMGDAQETMFRAYVANLGPGRVESLGPDERGLFDGQYTALTEGGQPHKMIAQLDILQTANARPAEYVVSASDGRTKLGDNEVSFTLQYLMGGSSEEGDSVDIEVPKNEFEMAVQIVKAQEGFVEEDPVDIINTDTHSLQRIGTLNGSPVIMMNVKRKYDDEGKYKQLNNAQKMQATHAVTGRAIAFTTSATYEPTSFVHAERSGVPATVLAYGTEKLASVKGDTEVTPPKLEQLGAELYKLAKLVK